MEKAKTFQDLLVWQKAHSFVLAVYPYSRQFPKDETFALGNQLRRAAVSIAANIAEGFRKRSDRDKLNFYNISQGSLEECRYYLILSHDLGYGTNQALMFLLEDISRMLNAYMKSLQAKVVFPS